MKAITISHAGASPQVSSNVDIPTPGEGQILVKTLYAAINSVDNMMSTFGSSVPSWPFTPGCDASGTIIKLGPNAVSALGQAWKEGDHVFGCTRVGPSGYTAWAEYLLFDANLCIPVPRNLNTAEAAGTGVGLLTATVGVFDKLGVPVLDPEKLFASASRDEWAVVFGGSGSVGQFTVQLLRVAGFKVITTSSAKSFELLKSLGATATIDYRKPEAEIVEEVKTITNGSLSYAFDVVSVNNDLLTSIYTALAPTTSGPRRYTTTNSWTPLPEVSNTAANAIQLGPIGQPGAVELNEFLKHVIPVVHKLLEQGTIKPSAYSVEGEAIEGIIKAWDVQKSGVKGSTKVVVKVADE